MRYLFVVVSILMVFSLSGRDAMFSPEDESGFHTSPAYMLEHMTPDQKENAIIQLECDGNAGVEARSIERLWNAGKYDGAIVLLKASEELKDAGLGIAWKNPVKASIKWGDDVLVSMRNVKPSIERVGSGIYGILYVNYPDEVALFDRSDWVSGIEEEFDNSGLYLTTTGPAVFNDGITINYSTPTNQRIRLDIYDFSGRHVKTLARGLTSGKHTVVWNGDRDDGKPALPGNYFCVLVTDGSKKVIKLTLVR